MAAVMCNAMFIMHYEEMIKAGVLPASLDDMPSYVPMVTPKLDGARLMLLMGDQAVRKGDMVVYDDKMANLKRRVDEAKVALSKELCDARDKAYGMELADQNANPTGLNPILADHYPSDTYGQVHKPLSAMIPKPTDTYETRQRMGQVHNKGARQIKPLSTAAISKITGKAMDLHKVRKFILPDDNKVLPTVYPVPIIMKQKTCDICGCTKQDSIKFYRADLKRFYCTSCYRMNRIDLKPVINWS
jgi:hypothetical protein